jgi:diketogulonate reductase-like aldo/keto reductase
MLDAGHISKLGIGGWGVGGLAAADPQNNDTQQVDATAHALARGMNYIEVNFWNAEGKSVELIKKAIDQSGKKREDLFLALVIYNYTNPTLADVEEEIEKYFALFQTDYIDTLEFPLSALRVYGFDSTTQLVSKYLSSGKARYTSLTNANLAYIKKYHDVFKDKFFSHEVHYSFEVRDNEYLGIIDYANKYGIKNVIYQPLRRNRTAQRNWPLLVELAQKYGKTQNQVILNWLVTKGFLPLVKSEHREHIDENVAALEFELSSEDIQKLDDFKVPHYKMQDIDWLIESGGTTIFSLPNTFDELYPAKS